MILVLVCTLLAFMALSMPIAVALGFSSLIALWYQNEPPMLLASSAFESLDSFSLMAVPFFILAGNLMQKGGIARRLVNLASAIVGWITGGLGAVVVLTSMFFATMSGSSSATAAAIGSMLIPEMEKKGYPRAFAASITASSGELGVIIPPSIPMIVYATSVNISIGDLFIAGILPGIMIGCSLILTVYVFSRIRGYDPASGIGARQWLVEFGSALGDALFAIIMPILILGGIYSGWFTPTEASVIAVVYGVVIGLFVYKELKWSELLDIFGRSAMISAVVLLLVAFAAIFAYILTVNQVPQKVGAALAAFSQDPLVFLLMINLLLFVVGMFMETLASIMILGPILAPVAILYGIDPVHFGVIIIVNLAVGMVTPPVGVNLFIVCSVARVRMEQLMRPLLVFLAVLICNVLIISYIPSLSLLLIK